MKITQTLQCMLYGNVTNKKEDFSSFFHQINKIIHNNNMKTIKNYNIYIFISTFTRNIIDIYSIIYLYQKKIPLKEIILIYTFIYFLGIFISKSSIILGNKLGYKYILIFSSITTSITFYIIHKTNSIYLISLFISLSMFTYHPIKHYYGLKMIKYKNQIGYTLILTYIASLLSSYIVINNLKIEYLIILSIISIIPSIFIKKERTKKIVYPKKISHYKKLFFIFDQFKIVFILLESLYLYTISNNISYVGIFNIVLTISSILFIYIFSNKIDIKNKYKYLNIIFTIILLLKININNKTMLLFIAFLEGIGIKINELVSTINLYSNRELNEGYIIICERIICLTRTLILSIIYLYISDLKIALYILLIGIFILSFQYKKNTI